MARRDRFAQGAAEAVLHRQALAVEIQPETHATTASRRGMSLRRAAVHGLEVQRLPEVRSDRRGSLSTGPEARWWTDPPRALLPAAPRAVRSGPGTPRIPYRSCLWTDRGLPPGREKRVVTLMSQRPGTAWTENAVSGFKAEWKRALGLAKGTACGKSTSGRSMRRGPAGKPAAGQGW